MKPDPCSSVRASGIEFAGTPIKGYTHAQCSYYRGPDVGQGGCTQRLRPVDGNLAACTQGRIRNDDRKE